MSGLGKRKSFENFGTRRGQDKTPRVRRTQSQIETQRQTERDQLQNRRQQFFTPKASQQSPSGSGVSAQVLEQNTGNSDGNSEADTAHEETDSTDESLMQLEFTNNAASPERCSELLRSVTDHVGNLPEDKRVLSFDLEWGNGKFRGPRKGSQVPSVISFSYLDGGGSEYIVKSIVVKLPRNRKALPTEIVTLLAHKSCLFVGRNIKGDVTRLKNNFDNCRQLEVNVVDLKEICERRFLIPKQGTTKLADYCELILGFPMDKSEQKSNWEAATLSRKQQCYAAKDVVYALRIYQEAIKKADMMIPPPRDKLTVGTPVDICPGNMRHGNPGCLGAIATVTDDNPETFQLSSRLAKRSKTLVKSNFQVVVHVTQLIAPSLKVPTCRVGRNGIATLGDFAGGLASGFKVLVPDSMLREHVPDRRQMAEKTSILSEPP